jgi:hypothetical protein
MPQLDIFADSRDVGLRIDLAQALLDVDVPAAERAAQSLRAEFGDDAVLTPAAVLIQHLQAQPPAAAAPSRPGAQAVLDARRHLEVPVTAAAAAVFDRGRRRPGSPGDGRRWRQGRHHEIVAQRARLKALSAPLMAAYMATR